MHGGVLHARWPRGCPTQGDVDCEHVLKALAGQVNVLLLFWRRACGDDGICGRAGSCGVDVPKVGMFRTGLGLSRGLGVVGVGDGRRAQVWVSIICRDSNANEYIHIHAHEFTRLSRSSPPP